MTFRVETALTLALVLGVASVARADVALEWDAPGERPVGGFVVERDAGAGGVVELARLSPDATRYEDTTNPPGRESCYRVRGLDAQGVTTSSARICVDAPAGSLPAVSAPPPEAPKRRDRRRTVGGWLQWVPLASPPATIAADQGNDK